MSLIKFPLEIPAQDDLITAHLNEIYSKLDSTLEPSYMMAQTLQKSSRRGAKNAKVRCIIQQFHILPVGYLLCVSCSIIRC
jgi:hypothetical protein